MSTSGDGGGISWPARFSDPATVLIPMRDTPRMVKMAERGFVDIDSVITMRVPLERAVEGWQAVADRTTLGMVVVFPD